MIKRDLKPIMKLLKPIAHSPNRYNRKYIDKQIETQLQYEIGAKKPV